MFAYDNLRDWELSKQIFYRTRFSHMQGHSSVDIYHPKRSDRKLPLFLNLKPLEKKYLNIHQYDCKNKYFKNF